METSHGTPLSNSTHLMVFHGPMKPHQLVLEIGTYTSFQELTTGTGREAIKSTLPSSPLSPISC